MIGAALRAATGAAGNAGGLSYPELVLSDSPWAYWRLGEPSGTTATDASGNGRHGTYVGSPTLAQAGLLAGDTDTSVLFDGTNDNVNLSGQTFSGTNMTFVALVKSSQTGTLKYLMDANPQRFVFAWLGTATNQIGIQSFGTWQSFGATPNDNVVHMVGFVISGNSAKCFVDGTQLGSTLTITSLSLGSATAWRLAAAYDLGGAFFAGTLDEVAVFASAFSDAKMLEYAQAAGVA